MTTLGHTASLLQSTGPLIILAAMPTPALQYGPYGTPSVIPGCYVTCLFRGVVKLAGLSTAAIPWPIGEKDGERALVVYRGLARALTCKPAEGIAAAWGVPLDAVKQWQATLRPKPERKPPPKRKLNMTAAGPPWMITWCCRSAILKSPPKRLAARLERCERESPC
jgi:hypothetical protein